MVIDICVHFIWGWKENLCSNNRRKKRNEHMKMKRESIVYTFWVFACLRRNLSSSLDWARLLKWTKKNIFLSWIEFLNYILHMKPSLTSHVGATTVNFLFCSKVCNNHHVNLQQYWTNILAWLYFHGNFQIFALWKRPNLIYSTRIKSILC